MSTAHRVCRAGELPVGSSRVVEVEGIRIGVFHLASGFYALLNRCPHRGAPLCAGKVTGLVTARRPQEFDLERPGEIVRCPWHGWEFDITTGRSVFNPHKVRTRTYPVTTEPNGHDGPDNPVGADSAEGRDGPTDVQAVAGEGIDAIGVESFPTTVEDDWVVVHLGRVVTGSRAGSGAGSRVATAPA